MILAVQNSYSNCLPPLALECSYIYFLEYYQVAIKCIMVSAHLKLTVEDYGS